MAIGVQISSEHRFQLLDVLSELKDVSTLGLGRQHFSCIAHRFHWQMGVCLLGLRRLSCDSLVGSENASCFSCSSPLFPRTGQACRSASPWAPPPRSPCSSFPSRRAPHSGGWAQRRVAIVHLDLYSLIAVVGGRGAVGRAGGADRREGVDRPAGEVDLGAHPGVRERPKVRREGRAELRSEMRMRASDASETRCHGPARRPQNHRFHEHRRRWRNVSSNSYPLSAHFGAYFRTSLAPNFGTLPGDSRPPSPNGVGPRVPPKPLDGRAGGRQLCMLAKHCFET